MELGFIILAALAIGFQGSFHCIGMCGPIALTLPIGNKNWYQKIIGIFLYNFGRTFTYGILGLLIGIIGSGFNMAGIQQWVSIITGALMILFAIVPSISKIFTSHKSEPFFVNFVKTRLGKLFRTTKLSSLFLIGLLNGLLPCGLVYIALASALAVGSLFGSTIFMIFFGLATIPMMFLVSMANGIISQEFRKKINKLIPFMVVLLGLLFILRGLGIGIPFVSPAEKKLHVQTEETIKPAHSSDSCSHCQ